MSCRESSRVLSLAEKISMAHEPGPIMNEGTVCTLTTTVSGDSRTSSVPDVHDPPAEAVSVRSSALIRMEPGDSYCPSDEVVRGFCGGPQLRLGH